MTKSSRAALTVVGWVFAGCAAHADRLPTHELEPPPPPSESARTAERAPVDAPERGALPVPDVVAGIHRDIFDRRGGDDVLGGVVCLVTVHEASLERGSFYPVVLFQNGSIATWRQTPTGREELFTAKLSADELVGATELAAAIREGSDLARSSFARSALIMGVSVRVGDRQETHYFDHARIPAALERLVGLLKHRLEATNRGP